MTAHPVQRHGGLQASRRREDHNEDEAVHRHRPGSLGTRFARTFPGATIKPGSGDTRPLTEPFDQGQLHGLLNRIRDFGIDILAVEATFPDPATTAAPWTTVPRRGAALPRNREEAMTKMQPPSEAATNPPMIS